MTPAERLRAAAQLARETAEAATAGPWRVTHYYGGEREPATFVTAHSTVAALMTEVGDGWGNDAREPDARHIALWSPPVALAVARLLSVWDERDLLASSGTLPDEREAILAVVDALLQTHESPAASRS